MAPSRNTRVRKLPATPLQTPANRQNTSTVATRRYLFSVGFTARRATSAEVSKASRLTLFLQANRSDLPAEVSKASRLTLFLQANRPDLSAEVSKASYLYSEVFDLKPTSGLYLKNSGRLFNFLTPRTVSEVFDLKPTSGLYLKNSAHLSNFLTPRTVSAIGRISAEFSAEFYFFAGFRQKRALRSGSVCSPINLRALALRRRSRRAPAADGRASALESPTAFDRTVRSPQLADRERATQRHVGPVAVEQASRRDGAALRRYPGTSCLATISLSLRDKSHSVS